MAVSSIILSKTFDNGVICASEQSVVVCEKVYDKVKAEFERRGAYFLSEEEKVGEAAISFNDNTPHSDMSSLHDTGQGTFHNHN